MRFRSLILLAVAAIGLAAAVWLYWGSGGNGAPERYLTAAVERGPLSSVVIATGVVNAVTNVQVGTYVSGPILAIDVDFNSQVEKGQRLAKIDPAPFRVKVARAEANLANAQATVSRARADLELKRLTVQRTEQLRRERFSSQNDLDVAKASLEQAQAELAIADASVRQAEAELEEARINLGYTDIISPVDGVVVSRNVDVGQTVAASFQTPTLFQVAEDLTRMRVIANVSESDIASVREGQRAHFSVDAFPGRTFEGDVVQVRNAPITVLNVVTYDVVIAVDNRELLLKPGMTATVTIITAAREAVLKASQRALGFDPERLGKTPIPARRAEDGEEVWRLGAGGEIERIPVETGIRDDAFVEITQGALREGDELVIGVDRKRERDEVYIPGMPRRR